jgi:deoxyribonuclease V
MWFKELHKWDVSIGEAVEIQKQLRDKLRLDGSSAQMRRVAGCDVHYDATHDRMVAAIVVMKLQNLEVVETATAAMKVDFPYVPGLLSFREAPALLEAFGRLRSKVDGVLIDGQGIAHPRGFGIASHIGLLLDLPTVGCAKSRLVGDHSAVPRKAGSHVPLSYHGQVVGEVVRTRAGVKPVFVSPGHRISIETARRLVLRACHGFRIPEPLRKAHSLARKLAKGEAGGHALR